MPELQKFKASKRSILIAVVVVIFGLLIYAFLFGPLFPWNPFKSGFTASNFKQATVYSDNATLDPAYQATDVLMFQVQSSLNLRFNRNVTIIICDKAQLARFLPWMNTGPIGGATLQIGDVIYINDEKLTEKGDNKAEYLGHELTHELVYQNTDLMSAINLSKIDWFNEGLAVYASGPNKYTNADFKTLTATWALKPCPTCSDLFEGVPSSDMNLKYKLYGLLLTEMRNSYGLYKFQNFVKDTSKAPDQVQDIFRKDFDVSLQDFLTKFQSRHWPTATTTTPTP